MVFHANACAFALNDEVERGLFVIILKLTVQFTFLTVILGATRRCVAPLKQFSELFLEISEAIYGCDRAERLSATVSIPYCESRNYPFIIDFGLFTS